MEQAKKERMANLELLRCIAMMMVVVLHYLGKGNLLGDLTVGQLSITESMAWVLEAFCLVAVNVYMLISGYFLSTSTFKPSRLLKLWLQVWFYSVVVGLVAVGMGVLPAEELNIHYLLSLLFPISMDHYWFMTAYVFLYLLLPFVTMAVQKMNKLQMQITLGGLLLIHCIVKSILPFRLETDEKGYGALWYLCVFLTAAYIRKFGVPFLNKKTRALGLYVVACLALLLEVFCFQQVYLRTGSLELIMKISTEYNHIFPFLASVGLFLTFLSVKVSGTVAKVVTKVAPYTLGVYLLHENMGVRYAWQNWLGADKVTGVGSLVLHVLLAVVVVFALGVTVDYARSRLMYGLTKLFGKLGWFRRLSGWMDIIDGTFAQNE